MNKDTIAVLIALVVGFVVGLFVGHSPRAVSMPSYAPNMPMSAETMMHNQVPMSPRQMMDAMSGQLQGKTGDDFDAAFLEQMIPHHMGAVAMAQMVLQTSKRPELVKLANDIMASQEKEIELMRGWQKSWFGLQAQ